MDKNKLNQIECGFCNTNAIYLCFKCNNYFCEKCFKIIHGLQKNSQHKKENIDLFVPINIKCAEHPEQTNYLFCLDEKSNLKIINYIFIIRNMLLMLLL